MKPKPFMDENFLLETDAAVRLYHEYAKNMPIFDYHCHLSPRDIAEDREYENISRLWLNGDHYKWRAMRSNGISEKYITGDASDREKFDSWAATVPYTIGNPLYHWTHLELRRYFGIEELLSPATADYVWEATGEKLARGGFSTKDLLRRSNVKVVCTTDDPVDSLEYHSKIKEDGDLDTRVLPTFRPDRALGFDNPGEFARYAERLSEASGVPVTDYDSFIEALGNRHDFFHNAGCRISDHALELPVYTDASARELETSFKKVLSGKSVPVEDSVKLKTAVLKELGRMNSIADWTMQLHIGALRNNNSRMFKAIGSDTGFDSIADGEIAVPLSRFLDSLDVTGELPKTIIYVLNPVDNYLIGTMIGNFQDGTVPGKIQFGSGWWFNDQKEGMEQQMSALANLGLLSRFVGMLTDSRSFLSYPRHEYFRRVLCNMVGMWVENGEAPEDYELLGSMVRNISFNNAVDYFGIEPQTR